MLMSDLFIEGVGISATELANELGLCRDEYSTSGNILVEKPNTEVSVLRIYLSDENDARKHMSVIEHKIEGYLSCIRILKDSDSSVTLCLMVTMTVGSSGAFTRKVLFSPSLMRQLAIADISVEVETCPSNDGYNEEDINSVS